MGRRKILTEVRFCACNCGGTFECKINSKQRFIQGHNLRVKNPLENPESREKMIRSKRGKTLSELGHKPDCKCSICKAKRGECKGENSYWWGKKFSEEQRNLLHKPHGGNSRHRKGKTNEEYFGKEKAAELKEANRRAHIGKKHKVESKQKNQTAGLKNWQNPEYRERQIKAIFEGLKLKPNKPEKFLSSVLQQLFPNEWKYTGDGSVLIGYKNPDFININGQKKIIELFGDYWHGKERTKKSKEKEEQQRAKYFAKYGYLTLIVWEYELKEVKILKEKLSVFNERR